MARRPNKLIPDSFTAVPSQLAPATVRVVDVLDAVDAVGVLVHAQGTVDATLGLSRAALERAGFTAAVGTVLVLAREDAPLLVAVGGGELADQDEASLRDAAAAFGRATSTSRRIGLRVPELGDVGAAAAAQALTEGAVLSRYRYTELQASRKDVDLAELQLVLTGADQAQASAGAAACWASTAAAPRSPG